MNYKLLKEALKELSEKVQIKICLVSLLYMVMIICFSICCNIIGETIQHFKGMFTIETLISLIYNYIDSITTLMFMER